MPLNLAKKIIDETIDEIEHHISLDLFGESLLYKDLVEVVRYIKEKRNIEVVLYTNAFTLDDQLLMELEQAGLDRITISLDAYGRDEFLRIKGVDKYINIVTNLYRFARRNIKIIVQFADLRYNSPKKKRNRITDIIRRLGFQVRNSRYISWCGEVPWLSDTPRKIREPKPCAYLFHYMNIASNGDMVMCCLDYNHKHTFGNVKRSKVMTVWNSKKAQALREKHMRGELPDMCLKCENEFYESSNNAQ
jgi:radical SAM protein with 4Fe4S-binding SPASM domain